MAFVYILQCSDGTFYTGMAVNLERRLQQHNNGRGAKYTRGRRPVELVYWEEKENISSALKREKQIQKMTRNRKIQLMTALKK